jgi:hypothetical protein
LSSIDRIFITTGRTKTAFATKRNIFKVTAVGTTIHCSAKGWVTTIKHPIDVLNNRQTRSEYINDFFIMIVENVLENIHMIIMTEVEINENPTPHD